MNTPSTILAASAVLALTSLPASATVAKTWVSSTGTDSGSCQLVAPCKTFQFAHDQTTAGGEIDVKDTGSYGQVTITKAISIVSGDGALAAVGVPSGGTGIMVSAGDGDRVLLQGLVIDGHGVGQRGIWFTSGKSLTVTGCHVRNVAVGIPVQTRHSSVFHLTSSEVDNASGPAVDISPAPGFVVKAALDRADLHDNDTGLRVVGNNSNDYTTAILTNSLVTDNQIGLSVASTGNVGIIIVSQTTIADSAAYGIVVGSNGYVYTSGDNLVNDNVSGSLSTFARR